MTFLGQLSPLGYALFALQALPINKKAHATGLKKFLVISCKKPFIRKDPYQIMMLFALPLSKKEFSFAGRRSGLMSWKLFLLQLHMQSSHRERGRKTNNRKNASFLAVLNFSLNNLWPLRDGEKSKEAGLTNFYFSSQQKTVFCIPSNFQLECMATLAIVDCLLHEKIHGWTSKRECKVSLCSLSLEAFPLSQIGKEERKLEMLITQIFNFFFLHYTKT